MSLRWIERDGKNILQELAPQPVEAGMVTTYKWEDVPVFEVPKEVQKPTEFWVYKIPLLDPDFHKLNAGTYLAFLTEEKVIKSDVFHVREVIPGSVTITKELLRQEWRRASLPDNEKLFNMFCHSIGLEEK